MAALTDQQRAIINGSFQMRTFLDMWTVIQQVYETMGLGSGMDDQTKISEYKYINEQLRKYIGTKQEVILSYGADLDGMEAEVVNLVSKGAEYGDERKVLVYNFMRDQWLIELYNAIQWAKNPQAYIPEPTPEEA